MNRFAKAGAVSVRLKRPSGYPGRGDSVGEASPESHLITLDSLTVHLGWFQLPPDPVTLTEKRVPKSTSGTWRWFAGISSVRTSMQREDLTSASWFRLRVTSHFFVIFILFRVYDISFSASFSIAYLTFVKFLRRTFLQQKRNDGFDLVDEQMMRKVWCRPRLLSIPA